MSKVSPTTTKYKFFSIATIILLCLVLYGNTINHGFNLDDNYVTDISIENKVMLHAFEENFDRVDYRPIPMTSFSLQKRYLGGITAKDSHLINLILFVLCSLTLFRFITFLFKDDKNKFLIAFCVTLLFIAHPIHSNVVASIKNRDILFSFIFSILSFTSFIKYFQSKKKRYLISCAFFGICGLLSKLDAIWVVMIIPSYYFLNNGKINPKVIFNTLKFAAFTFAILFVRLNMQDELDSYVDPNPILFTENPMIGSGIKGMIFYTVYSFFYYIKFMLVPFGYYFYFGYQTIPSVNFLHPYFIVGLFLLILTFYALFKTYKRNKLLTIQIMFYLTALFFFVNFMRPVAGVVAPRLAFHASAAFCLLLVYGIYHFAKSDYISNILTSMKSMRSTHNKTILLTFLVILFYAPFTISRNLDWKSRLTLMDADMPNLKHSFQANRIASAIYLRTAENPNNFENNKEWKKIVKKGLAASKNGAKIDPENIFVQEGIGIAEYILGNEENALRQFNLVIEKFDTSEVAWDFSADIYNNNKNYDEAIFYYKNALRISPLNLDIFQKLNRTAIVSNRIENVIPFYDLMARDNPEWYVPFENLGTLYLHQKDTLTAAMQFNRCFANGKKDFKTYNLLAKFLERNNYDSELAIFKGNFQN